VEDGDRRVSLNKPRGSGAIIATVLKRPQLTKTFCPLDFQREKTPRRKMRFLDTERIGFLVKDGDCKPFEGLALRCRTPQELRLWVYAQIFSFW
jgi:hypothetical protein